MVDYSRKTYVTPGTKVYMEISFSECAMSMRVAGTVMEVELIQSQACIGCYAQLYKGGKEYSAPITSGEAGFYYDNGGYYYYPPRDADK